MEFHKKYKNLNDSISDKKKILKQLNNNITSIIKQTNSNEHSIDNIKEQKHEHKVYFKNSLFLKRINLKESKNKYYVEGVFKLFNDQNIFLDNIYKGKKIVIGKSRSRSSNNYINLRKSKKSNSRKMNTYKQKSRNMSSSNINMTRSTLFGNETSLFSRTRKLVSNKKDLNYITDDDLNNLYQECINREKYNLKKNMDKTKFKTSVNYKKKDLSDNEYNNILNLQSKILNKYKLRKMETKRTIDKLLLRTSKEREKLLMNQINDYRLKKEKIDEIDINNILKNTQNNKNKEYKKFESQLQWLSSLRDYQNDNKTISDNNRCLSKNNKDNKDSMANLKSFYSFDKREILYNLCRKTSPLFAQINPKICKENEKIRDTLNDSKCQKNCKKNFNLSLEKYLNNKKRIESYRGLNIRGRKLINFEMEISKDLEGKKKRIVQYPYKEEEITNKIYAKSKSVNNFYIPKSVKNTIDLHYNNK